MLSIKIISLVLIVCLVNLTFIQCAVPMDADAVFSDNDPSDTSGIGTTATKTSWIRRQMSRLGGVAGDVGNAVGRASINVSTTAEKICNLVKKIIPILAAICHVGQFKFCASTGLTPGETIDTSAGGIDTIKLETLD